MSPTDSEAIHDAMSGIFMLDDACRISTVPSTDPTQSIGAPTLRRGPTNSGGKLRRGPSSITCRPSGGASSRRSRSARGLESSRWAPEPGPSPRDRRDRSVGHGTRRQPRPRSDRRSSMFDLPNVEVVCGPATSFDEPGVRCRHRHRHPRVQLDRQRWGFGPESLLAHLARQVADNGVSHRDREPDRTEVPHRLRRGPPRAALGRSRGLPTRNGPRTWSKAASRPNVRGRRSHRATLGVSVPGLQVPAGDPRRVGYESQTPSDLSIPVPLARQDSSEGPHLLCDSGSTPGMLDAGLGPAVANSFLVVAGRDEAAIGRHVRPALAWLTGRRRRSTWQRWRELRSATTAAERLSPSEAAMTAGNLPGCARWRTPRCAGSTVRPRGGSCWLRSRPIGGCNRRHPGRLDEPAHGEQRRRHDDRPPSVPRQRDDRVVPGDMIDSNFSNWVISDDGSLRAHRPGMDCRSRRGHRTRRGSGAPYLAHDIIVRGVAHPWTPTATVRELASTLGALVRTQTHRRAHRPMDRGRVSVPIDRPRRRPRTDGAD